MKKSEIRQMPEYFDKYIHLVQNIDLMEAFEKSLHSLNSLDLKILKEIGNNTYAPGKWTVKEIIQHLSDWERIFCYRTLICARNEEAYPQGFDEDYLSLDSRANNRQLEDLTEELISVRRSTITLFKSFAKDDFAKTIITYRHKISVLAMGFHLVWHQLHHLNIIDEKYSPLRKSKA